MPRFILEGEEECEGRELKTFSSGLRDRSLDRSGSQGSCVGAVGKAVARKLRMEAMAWLDNVLYKSIYP